MINQNDLHPDQEILIVARTADGPAIRARVRDIRALFEAGMLEVGPRGGSIQISDKGIEYGKAHRKSS